MDSVDGSRAHGSTVYGKGPAVVGLEAITLWETPDYGVTVTS